MLRASHRGGPGETSSVDATMPVSSVIRFEGVSKHFQSTAALHNVSATIPPGQFVAIIGCSGAGKTTLLHCLSRTTTVTAGSIRFGTCDLTSLHGAMLRQHRARVGMIYQQFHLVKRLHVRDNVLVGRLPHLSGVAWWLALGRSFPAAQRAIALVAPVVQIRHGNGSLGYRSCLIVHADSDIFSPEDIGGKTFAFNDPNSTSGYLVPMTMFLNAMGINPKQHFSKLTFSGSHEASILAVMHKKVEVASTNLPDIQQLTREGKVPRAALRIIWVSKLIPNDPIVVRKDLPDSLRQAIQDALVAMQEKHPEVFAALAPSSVAFRKSTMQNIR